MDYEAGVPVLLAGGNATSVHHWDDGAAAVLRKARRLAADVPDGGAWDALSQATVEGIQIPPLGTPRRLLDRGGAMEIPEPASVIARTESGWDIRALVVDANPVMANASAIDDLQNGATSLWLTVGGNGTSLQDLPRVLDGVHLQMAPIGLHCTGDMTEQRAASELEKILTARGVRLCIGSSLGADPVGRALRSAAAVPDLRTLSAQVGQIGELATGLGARALVVDASVAHEAGAGDAAELGYALSVGVEYLRVLQASGSSVNDAFELVEFRFSATAEQFISMAKFRAARGLWRRVAELSGAADGAGVQVQHAVTSLPMMTRYDPWVNLLRTTVAAFAAGVGGADAVTVLPFDTRLGVPDALGRRMARNISSLLISEAHAAAVVDPAAGSTAVEMLTRSIAEAAWAEFQRIERAGGILAALADDAPSEHSVGRRWAITATERAGRVASRRQPITGVSEFPNLREVLPTRRAQGQITDRTRFWAEPFEAMRDCPTAQPVFLATLGGVAEHAARAGFMANLFAAGGIDTVTAGATAGVTDVMAAFNEGFSPVVCLVGTDSAYAELGALVIQRLRSAGASRVILAGQPQGQFEQLIDDHFAAGDDAVTFLQRTRQRLSSTGPQLPVRPAARDLSADVKVVK